MKLTKMLKLRTGEKGAAMVEYALLASLIAVVVIAAVTLIGTNVKTVFQNIANALQ